jgi:hypothetical protein
LKKIKFIVQSSLAIFHSVSRSADLKDSFTEIKALNVINRFLDVNSPEIRSLAYMFMANVATNEDDVSLIDKSSKVSPGPLIFMGHAHVFVRLA